MKTIKNILLISSLLISCIKINSQARLNNLHTFSAGVGAVSTAGINYYSTFITNKDLATQNFGPFHLKYEYAISDKFSDGMSLGYLEINGSWNAGDTDEFLDFSDPNAGSYRVSSTSFVARFNWNMLQREKIDIYFGAGAGYRFDTYEENVVNSEVYGRPEEAIIIPPIY